MSLVSIAEAHEYGATLPFGQIEMLVSCYRLLLSKVGLCIASCNIASQACSKAS